MRIACNETINSNACLKFGSKGIQNFNVTVYLLRDDRMNTNP